MDGRSGKGGRDRVLRETFPVIEVVPAGDRHAGFGFVETHGSDFFGGQILGEPRNIRFEELGMAFPDEADCVLVAASPRIEQLRGLSLVIDQRRVKRQSRELHHRILVLPFAITVRHRGRRGARTARREARE
jgi:hypothetical protein